MAVYIHRYFEKDADQPYRYGSNGRHQGANSGFEVAPFPAHTSTTREHQIQTFTHQMPFAFIGTGSIPYLHLENPLEVGSARIHTPQGANSGFEVAPFPAHTSTTRERQIQTFTHQMRFA